MSRVEEEMTGREGGVGRRTTVRRVNEENYSIYTQKSLGLS